MNYFVKAIPREGKIESGDYVFFKINGKWIGPADFDSILGSQIEDVKRAVFYLCSRDIKVGDIATEMLDNGDFEDFEIHTENDIYLEFIKDGFQFKIVAEASREALSWVNEDDEFDESEVKLSPHPLCPKCGAISNDGFCPEDLDCQINRKRTVAYFKCPKCKVFH
jgi:hypothetical protein